MHLLRQVLCRKNRISADQRAVTRIFDMISAPYANYRNDPARLFVILFPHPIPLLSEEMNQA